MKIVLKKVRVHNLKSVDLTLDPFQLIVFTGFPGRGNLHWRLIQFIPKDKEGMSSHSRPTQGGILGIFPSLKPTESKGFRPQLPLSRKQQDGRRGQPLRR
jgi:hypothetical protein